MVNGLGVVLTAFSVLAMGCMARAPGDTGNDGESVGEAGEAVKYNGCPNDVVVATANYAPPHAFPGRCYGPSSEQQAKYDGATQELVSQCVTYCGSSYPACGQSARLVNWQCIDRDIGHRWNALCVCGADGGGHGNGWNGGYGNGWNGGHGNDWHDGWHDGHGGWNNGWHDGHGGYSGYDGHGGYSGWNDGY
ncbi:MAG: hypothetical protein QM820_63360 [Minicystis sp.]